MFQGRGIQKAYDNNSEICQNLYLGPEWAIWTQFFAKVMQPHFVTLILI